MQVTLTDKQDLEPEDHYDYDISEVDDCEICQKYDSGEDGDNELAVDDILYV